MGNVLSQLLPSLLGLRAGHRALVPVLPFLRWVAVAYRLTYWPCTRSLQVLGLPSRVSGHDGAAPGSALADLESS